MHERGHELATITYYAFYISDNNRNGVDRRDDRLWKIQDLFEIISTNFSKLYNPSKHLAVDEVIVKF
jgi:hypothetical protein